MWGRGGCLVLFNSWRRQGVGWVLYKLSKVYWQRGEGWGVGKGCWCKVAALRNSLKNAPKGGGGVGWQ